MIRLLLCVFLTSASLGLAQFTEYPQTVKPGRFLLEMDALSITFDREDQDKLTAFGVASTFLTTGLTENLDIQIGVDLFLSQRITSGGLKERDTGLGDLYLRSKWRFYEDETIGVSAAAIPYVKLPTGSGGVGSEAVEGGVIFPWQASLSGDAAINAMAGVELTRNDADDGYDSYWYASATAGVPLTGSLHVYGEASLAKSTGGSPWEAVLGAGVLLYVREQMWWDFAVHRGVSDGAADWNPVVRFNFGF